MKTRDLVIQRGRAETNSSKTVSAGIRPHLQQAIDTQIDPNVPEAELQKRIGVELQASYRFLEITSKQITKDTFLRECITELKRITGCSAVGIRISDKTGNIPYVAHDGFPTEFYKLENLLNVHDDECVCVYVMINDIPRDQPMAYTDGGSFYMNDLQNYIEMTPKPKRKIGRAVCPKCGFASWAVVPIKFNCSIQGVIHLADYRKNMVPLQTILLLERMALYIGIALNRFLLEGDREHAKNVYNSLFSQINEGVLLVQSQTGVILDVNPEFERQVGRDKTQLVEMKIWDFNPSTITALVKAEFIKACSIGLGECRNIYFQMPSGQLRKVDLSFRTIQSAGQDSVQVISRDMVGSDVPEPLSKLIGSENEIAEHSKILTEINQRLQREIVERNQVEDELRHVEIKLRQSEKELRLLANRLLNTQEFERNRIARELHDRLGQDLFALKTQISSFCNKCNEVKLCEIIQLSTHRLDELMDEVREIAREIRPSLIDNHGILSAIQNCAETFERQSGIPCPVSIPTTNKAIKPETSICLFRILQEALNNVHRHSHASLASVNVTMDDNNLTMRVADNGIGIRINQVPSDSELGILGMVERAHLVGGELTIESQPGQGTMVIAKLPYRESAVTLS